MGKVATDPLPLLEHLVRVWSRWLLVPERDVR